MSKREAALAMRAKILGVLLKDARLASGKTVKECADAVGTTVRTYKTYEAGKKTPSLPELELLALLFNAPLDHFWGSETISDPKQQLDASQLPAAEVNRLRDRIIGATLRKTRLAAKMKLKDLAAQTGLPAGRISAYEFGRKSIPIPELELIAAQLGLSIEDLMERRGPVGEWESLRRDFERFRQLPDDLREFIGQPMNETYLRLALSLSQMPAEKLRRVAESLLEITY